MNILLNTFSVFGMKKEKIYFFNNTDHSSHLLSRYISSFESSLLYVRFRSARHLGSHIRHVSFDQPLLFRTVTNCFVYAAHEHCFGSLDVACQLSSRTYCKLAYYNFLFHTFVSAARFIFSPTLNETGKSL